MEAISISWLVTSASAPLVVVLALWTLYVFHTYRRRWRTVDLFLLALISQELVLAISTFGFALVSLIGGPAHPVPCTLAQFGLVAVRTFQVATLASMVVDRALTVRWPYRYRFSVRRNQIRYHVSVLALVSTLVGVAAVFARLEPDNRCRLHPAQWDIRYVLFVLSLYAFLILVSLICMVQVEIHRVRHGAKASDSFQLPECVSPDLPSATGMNSPLDTQSSTGSTRALHRPSRQASRRPYAKDSKGTSDLRWPSVALTCLLCFLINHIPYLVLVGLASWHAPLWSPWHESILSWLGMLEGFLVPFLLFCRDPAMHAALRRAFQRRSGALSPLVSDEGPFQMYFDKDHFRKRGTFGSVTPVGIITNYRRTPGKKARRKGGGKYTLPGLHGGDSVLAKSCFMGGNAEPLSKLSCADLTSLEMWREEEENFYATLSDDFSTFSCKSGDDSALSEDLRMSEEVYGGSFTTVANDDFEFHDTRPCGGEVKMKPALVSPATPPSRKTSFRGNIFTKVDLPKVPRARGGDLFDFKENSDDERKDPELSIVPSTTDLWLDKGDPEQPSDLKPSPKRFGTLSRHPKPTSYSMNDLDLIHQKGSRLEHEPESTFLLPVKSESTMSLYRLNVDQELDPLALTPSRSENNVNGDSGFGSGAQSTNPVWSGFLCRKPSDPFWNIRKPTTAVATTPNKNYPAILHPRMRKIPWISAWKKLDENSIHNERRKEESLSSQAIVGWKENLMYESNATPIKSTIDEELSDVNSPVCNGDYNLNIFAKESGVLMENAYGKIVRDDCGVQVNFYGTNAQYDDKDITGDSSNVFERSVQPTEYNDERNLKLSGKPDENHLQSLNDSSPENMNVITKQLALEKLFEEPTNQFKCEPKPNGRHYENLFGTKENIFSQCDQHLDKKQTETDDQKVHREDSFRNKNLVESKSIYGQLNKPERQESGKSPSKLRRRESDNRGNRCGVRRREGRTRSDPRSNFLTRDPNSSLHFSELTAGISQTIPDQKIEIEMQSVHFACNLNSNNNRFPKLDPSGLRYNGVFCRDSTNEERRPDKNLNNLRSNPSPLENETTQRVERRDSRNKNRPGLELRSNDRKRSGDVGSSVWPKEGSFRSKLPTPVHRRESAKDKKPSCLPVRVDKIEKNLHNRVDDSKTIDINKDNPGKKPVDNRNEGLWVNAVPFNRDEQNANSPRKDFRKDRLSHRSPRKSHLPRRENSDNKGNARVRRKVSGSRPKTEKLDLEKDESSECQKWAKEIANRANGDGKRHDTQMDDFLKYRDKCEDNFSHIQNLNRERSTERESSRLDHMLLSGKLNGNIAQNGEMYPFETFHEGGKMQLLHNTRPSFDNNENCQEKRLAITDFL
ncbi:hypothetical protein HNY73_017333 [Argiope bruennichi]|uniref:G-protein coupled receptors family 1 profile domain-containing protein n=2 Tax=Argiope bruennichi TaxID=94029 RepID=A0A8T0ELG6_ARGBR|nr:hypothetical protein HNY73_017333 [Argiope bruennichi]